MIIIDDKDLPITVAEKLITGTKPYNPTPFMQSIVKAVTGDEHAAEEQDMFSIEDIKEIAEYLMTYYNANDD